MYYEYKLSLTIIMAFVFYLAPFILCSIIFPFLLYGRELEFLNYCLIISIECFSCIYDFKWFLLGPKFSYIKLSLNLKSIYNE